jgi:hypothetical protein
MCSCCYTAANTNRVFTTVFDPIHVEPFDPKWEKELSRMSMFDLRDRMYKFVTDRQPLYGVPLCINPHSAAYKNFAKFVFHIPYCYTISDVFQFIGCATIGVATIAECMGLTHDHLLFSAPSVYILPFAAAIMHFL